MRVSRSAAALRRGRDCSLRLNLATWRQIAPGDSNVGSTPPTRTDDGRKIPRTGHGLQGEHRGRGAAGGSECQIGNANDPSQTLHIHPLVNEVDSGGFAPF
jgi:hypothetical protein